MEFFKSNFISSNCYFMPKELHPNRQYAFTTMILICHSLECRDLKEEVFLCGWITFLWRRIFPLRLRILILTHLQAEKVSSVLPENLMAFLTLGNNLKELFFTRNQLPLLIPPHNLYGSSSQLVHGCFLDKPQAIPLTRLSPRATMATVPPSMPPWHLQSLSLMHPVFLFSEWLSVSFSHSLAKISFASQELSWPPLVEGGDSFLMTHLIFIG